MTSGSNAVEARDLQTYRQVHAPGPINLTIPDNSIVALVGHNGAGKTTLLELLLNILQPSSGEATVLGVPATDVRGASFCDIGYASESQELPE